jgi:hypothetical protein
LLLGEGVQHRQRQRSLSLSEIMTILVSFHQQQYRNFKAFYWFSFLEIDAAILIMKTLTTCWL